MLVLATSSAAQAQNPFTLTGVVPDRTNHGVDIDTKGTVPADLSPYKSSQAWRIWVTKPKDPTPKEPHVESVFWDDFTRKFVLSLSGQLPDEDQYSLSGWTVLFVPEEQSGLAGAGLAYTAPTGPNNTSPSNCDPTTAIHYLCVPASSATPDITLSGAFTAAGGTNPLYQFQLQGGLYLEKDWRGFRPGFTTNTQVNQTASTPVNRTTFDPDSITAGLAFQKLKYLDSSPLDLYGIQFDETLPGGEFTRKDPTSNIIVASTAQFILRSFTKPGHRTYGTLHPLLGMEVGHNLNKPREFDSVPIDLSHYNAIVRGIGGANASFAHKSQDATADVWSVTASYVVRIPATDEPLVKTLHQTTTAELTDRARHWVEVDGNLSPWSFRYLSITAKYQYGSLPPAFNFVDHSFSIGLTLKASQANKPNAAGPPLSQQYTPNP